MDEVIRGVASMDPFSAAGSASAVPQPSHASSSGQDSSGSAAQMQAFSVKASEFVPKSLLNVDAKEFVPRSMASNTSQWAFTQAHSMSSASIDPVAEVRSSVGSLVYSPGRFDLAAQQMVDIIINCVQDVNTLKLVLDVILDTCLRETNFRYTGARLLDFLSASLLDTPFETKTFHQVLMEKCQATHTTTLAMAVSEPWRLRSFTMFMADLCLQLGVYTPDGFKQRLPVLSSAVLDLLIAIVTVTKDYGDKIQQDEAKENFKAIAQTLKLSGMVLEMEERGLNATGESPKMDELMSRLSSSAKDPAVTSWLPTHISQMLLSLVDLRKSNWGQQVPSGTEWSQHQQQQQYHIPKETNSLDSGELTPEELQFLQEQMGVSDDLEEDDTADEMTAEMEAAYEQFLADMARQ